MKKIDDSFLNNLVESYSNPEKEVIGLKKALEFSKALCSSRRNRKWAWNKGSRTDDYYAFIRALMLIDTNKTYSIEQISKLTNIPNGYIRKKMDYDLLLENRSSSLCHRSFRYSIGYKGFTKEDCFNEIIATQELKDLTSMERAVARDLLVRCRQSGMTVSEILSSSTEEIIDRISSVPMNISYVILKEIGMRKRLTVAVKTARLCLIMNAKHGYNWIPSNVDEKTRAFCESYMRMYEEKLQDAMRRPMATVRDFKGRGIEFSGDWFYYTFKNGKTSMVSYEELRQYVYEECVEILMSNYRKAIANIEREMEVR